MSHSPNTTCPVCQTRNISSFIEMPPMPVYCNLLWPSRQGALQAVKGDIHLGFCHTCGHIFNTHFDLSLMDYTQDYENSLHFSPRFQQYATALAQRLITDHNLHHKELIGIGSGKGDFLKMLCQLGQNRATGFDPSYAPTPEEAAENTAVTFVQDYYTDAYTHYPADFISCRHVLEHIPQAANFIQMVRRAIGSRLHAITFFEVPNALFTLRDLGIWDIIYEHCSYFTPHSLAYVFQQNQFHIHKLDTTFNGQFLTIEARPHTGEASALPEAIDPPSHIAPDVNRFAHNYQQKVTTWQQRLDELQARGQKAVVWGAGSKGVTFLNTLKTQDHIRYVVDINPRKKGMFVAGTGQEIVPPDFLRTYQPQVVIIMNANYQEEIGQQLQTLGVTADILLA